MSGIEHGAPAKSFPHSFEHSEQTQSARCPAAEPLGSLVDFGKSIARYKPEHIRHGVPPRLLVREPLGGLEGAVDEGVAVGGDVGEFEAFAEGGEVGGVPADLVADAQGVHADLAALADGFVAVAVVDERVLRLVRWP